MNKKCLKLFYELVFIILAFITVTISILDIIGKINIAGNELLQCIDTIIIVIFAIDYFIRLIISKDKKIFIKTNIPDLIAIIPFSSLFKIFRILKITKIIRLTKLIKLSRLSRTIAIGSKINKNLSKFFNTNGLIYVLIFTLIIILLGSLGIYICERGYTIETFSDAIWWSFVTATTVGYGDISPSTNSGRIIAGVLMIVGIGTIGMLTGSIATFFLKKDNEVIKNDTQIIDLSDLTTEQYNKVIEYIEFLKIKK